jgi:LCP family protein required for cell wall assembly
VTKVTLLLFLLLIVAAAIWAGIAYTSFRSAVQARNKLVPKSVRAALTPANGPMLTHAQNILMIGSDTRGHGDTGRSDSMIVMRVDIPKRRISMLSIPRDLRVPIPGADDGKINSAYSIGGAALTIKTIHAYTGIEINHYMLVNFHDFKQVIDAVGGITIVNDKPIKSNKFDGRVWTFKKGVLHLNGKRALAYSRVRENLLDPSESDFTRGRRQQAVLDALSKKILSWNAVMHPNKVPHAVVQPLITDLSALDFIELGLAKKWAKSSNALHCRLGGESETVDGQSEIVGDETNKAVVNMWLGQQAPVKPDTRLNQYAPGCTVGGQ